MKIASLPNRLSKVERKIRSRRHQEIILIYVTYTDFEPPTQVQHYVHDELTRRFPDTKYIFKVDFTELGICKAYMPDGILVIEYDEVTWEIKSIQDKPTDRRY